MPIESGPGGVMITGNAVYWFRALHAKHGLAFYLKTGMVLTRGAGPKRLCSIITEYTGTKYPNTRKGWEQALTDITATVHKNPDTVVADGAQ